MSTLQVVSETSGAQLGRLLLTEAGAIEATGLGADIFAQIKRAKGVSDRETFKLLAGGWSNGYITIPALATA